MKLTEEIIEAMKSSKDGLEIVRTHDDHVIEFRVGKTNINLSGRTGGFSGKDLIYYKETEVKKCFSDAKRFLEVKEESCHEKIYKGSALLKELFDNKLSFTLVGGAVIDIYEGKTPKDYDFINLEDKFLDKCVLVDTSDVADTYTYTDKSLVSVTIQLLKTKLENFDFTISTCIIENREHKIDYDRYPYMYTNLPKKHTYKSKILVPCSYEPRNALNSLLRIPHWRKKGYTITDNTYRSLLFAATKISKERSGEFKKMSQ